MIIVSLGRPAQALPTVEDSLHVQNRVATYSIATGLLPGLSKLSTKCARAMLRPSSRCRDHKPTILRHVRDFALEEAFSFTSL